MSSNPLETLHAYNNALSCQSPIQYLHSFFRNKVLCIPQEDPQTLAKKMLLETNIYAAPVKLTDPASFEILNRVNLPNSSEAVYSIIRSSAELFAGIATLTYIATKIRTRACKIAFAKDLFGKVWLPFGILDYYTTNKQRENILKDLANKIEPAENKELNLREAQQMLWRERRWIYELVNKYETKLGQVREGHQEMIPKLITKIRENTEKRNVEKQEVVPRANPEEDKRRSAQLSKEIEKEKNYMEALFIDLEDVLDEVEGAEISFIQK